MYYPDLRSLADVDNLPMPEFHLRFHCITERIRWERGSFGAEPAEPTQPVPKRRLIEVLAALKQRRLAEERKHDAKR